MLGGVRRLRGVAYAAFDRLAGDDGRGGADDRARGGADRARDDCPDGQARRGADPDLHHLEAAVLDGATRDQALLEGGVDGLR